MDFSQILVYNDTITTNVIILILTDIYDEEVFIMLKEVTYTIKPDKSEEFFKKLYSTAPSKDDWDKIRKESQILDKERLESLFSDSKR